MMKKEEPEEKPLEAKEEPEAEAVEKVEEHEAEDKEMEELAEELAKEDEMPEEKGAEEAEEKAEAPTEEEEALEEKPAEEKKAEKKEEEEEIVEERFYTIPLSKAWIYPKKKRAPRAMRILKSFVTKHMKLEGRKPSEGEEEEELGRLIVSNEVNLKMWDRGIGKPPRKIRVRAAKDKEGNVTVYLAEAD